ncbi:hypothetical protein B0J13DRAFT_569602 [Dactylonectria estremocensis]|uniref:Uncharacterized protein n=1 Tax=Dactylonectria estremocensis TaxID=1079267 RepID=A0A9P9DFU0_9HYPO|nr:hypothetical protein B0J13DRAFT_569602 [Dactylonectria estremocensis]
MLQRLYLAFMPATCSPLMSLKVACALGFLARQKISLSRKRMRGMLYRRSMALLTLIQESSIATCMTISVLSYCPASSPKIAGKVLETLDSSTNCDCCLYRENCPASALRYLERQRSQALQ